MTGIGRQAVETGMPVVPRSVAMNSKQNSPRSQKYRFGPGHFRRTDSASNDGIYRRTVLFLSVVRKEPDVSQDKIRRPINTFWSVRTTDSSLNAIACRAPWEYGGGGSFRA